MSEATEVPMPMVCVDCGGGLTNRGVMHMTYSQCIASLNERLTAATQRAEAAEAGCEALLSVIERVRPRIHLDAALAVQSTTGESK